MAKKIKQKTIRDKRTDISNQVGIVIALAAGVVVTGMVLIGILALALPMLK